MITADFLGRVHGALAGMGERDPGYRVLQELAGMFQGEGKGAVVAKVSELPAVAYLSPTLVCTWTAAMEVDLGGPVGQATPMVQLRLMHAMLTHSLAAVEAEISRRVRAAEPELPHSLGGPGRLGGVPNH